MNINGMTNKVDVINSIQFVFNTILEFPQK